MKRLIIFAAVLWPRVLVAQQPFNGNDAPTIENGKWQFQFLNSGDLLGPSFRPLTQQGTSNFSLGYGLSDWMELGIAIPHIGLKEKKWRMGIGDLELNTKVKLIGPAPEHPGRPAISVASKLEFPTGNRRKGFGSGRYDWDNTLIVETQWLGFTHRWNAGIGLFGDTSTGVEGIRVRTTSASYGYSVSRQVTPRLRWGGEITGSAGTHVSFADAEMEWMNGGNYQLSPRAALDFGYSYGLKRANPAHGFIIGFTITGK